MELVIRMKTITRTLIFLGSILIWLVALVLLNGAYLHLDDLVVLGAAAVLAVGDTFVLAKVLRT